TCETRVLGRNLQRERDVKRVRIRRVDLTRHANALEGLGDRIDLELLRFRDLLDAHEDSQRAFVRSRGAHIDRAPCRRSRRSFHFATSAAPASRKTRSARRSFPLPSTVYRRSAISSNIRG